MVDESPAAIDTPLHRVHQAAVDARSAGETAEAIINVAFLGATTEGEKRAIAEKHHG